MKSRTKSGDLETSLTPDLIGTWSYWSYGVWTSYVQVALRINGSIGDELELVCNSSRFLGHDLNLV